MKDLQELVGKLTRKWAEAGQGVVPDQRDCLDYIATTAAKAIATRLRLQRYVRNPPPQTSLADVDREVADTIFMCLVWFNLRGMNAVDKVMNRLSKMDRERS